MKVFLVAVLVAIAVAAPAPETTTTHKPIIEILSSSQVSQPDGSYEFAFEGADGSYRQEKGIVLNAGTEDEVLSVEGVYRFINAENQPQEVHYTSNDKGFVPSGGEIDPAISTAARLASEHVEPEPEAEGRILKIKKLE